MADERNEQAQDTPADAGATGADAARGPGKRALLLSGSVLSILALAFIASVMAVPSRTETQHYDGPFSVELFAGEKFICNLAVDSRKRYLQMRPEVMYYAYDEDYALKRTDDNLYLPLLRNALISVCSSKTLEDIYGDVGESTFMEELRAAIAAIIFPIHIGDTTRPMDLHKDSGLRPGISSDTATFRGRFHEHVLHVDAIKKSVRLDDGPEVEFMGNESDLPVRAANGDVLYLDVTRVESDFVDEVPVGVRGEIVRVLTQDLLIQ